MAELTYIYDAVLGVDGGVDGYTVPESLPKNKIANAVNCSLRNQCVSNRPSFRKINLSGDVPSGSIFQEACYYQPDSGSESIFAVLSGRLFQFTPDSKGNATVTEQTQSSGGQSATSFPQWMRQSEQFLVWNDGLNLPIFFDGSLTRRSLGNSNTVYTVVPANPPIDSPSVGQSVVVSLSSPPSSTFAQTVALQRTSGGTTTTYYYSVSPYNPSAAVAGGNTVLGCLYDSTGTTYQPGQQVLIIPSRLAVITGTVGSPSIVAWGSTNRWKITFTVDYTGNFTVGLPVNVQGIIGFTFGISQPVISDISANQVSIEFQDDGTNRDTFNNPTVGSIVTAVNPAANSQAGILADTFVSEGVGNNVPTNLVAPYVGSVGIDVWMNNGHYLIFPNSGQNTVVLTNIDDTPGVALSGMTLYSLPELPAGRMGEYGMGRNWQSGIDGISYIGGDIVGSSSGNAAYGYRDAVLKMTQNQTLLTGTFRVPGGAGRITAMSFPAQLDTSLGQGPLQVFTERGVFSCLAPIDPKTWQTTNNPLQTESLKGSGAVSAWSVTLANADIFFRSTDGQIRSLVLSRLDFNRWGDTPIGLEMSRVLDAEDDSILYCLSSISFDNRYLTTATPKVTQYGITHSDIISLNFDPISGVANKSHSIFDGNWNGLNVFKIVTGVFSGIQRAFAFVLNESNQIELWEILKQGASNGLDNSSDRISFSFETPCFFNSTKDKGPFTLCRLSDGEIYADSMSGNVDFLIEYRPDFDQTWHTWSSWTVNAGSSTTYQMRMGFGQPPLDDNNAMHRPSRDAYFFQLRVTITGPARVRGIRLKASLLPQPDFAPMVDGALTLEPSGAVQIVDRFVLREAPASGNKIYSGCPDPNGVQIGYIGDEYNQICDGTFIETWIKVSGDGTNTGWV